jgi:hypothetical protein
MKAGGMERAMATGDLFPETMTTGKAMDSTKGNPKTRQQRVDPKGPLTDKGVGGWRRRIERELEAIHAEMRTLAQQTQRMARAEFGLYLYWRKPTGQQSLRWRLTGGRHVTWEFIRGRLPRMPPALARQYEELNERGLVLNARELARRAELRTCELVALEREKSYVVRKLI